MNDLILSKLTAGASVGTELFYYSGYYLARDGPVALFLAYLFMGTVLYAVLVSTSVRNTVLSARKQSGK